jgi:hypothetical protein
MPNTQPFPAIRSAPFGGLEELRKISDRQTQAYRASHHSSASQRSERLWHRVHVLGITSLVTLVLYAMQGILWPHDPLPHGWLASDWAIGTWLWAIGIFPQAAELTGMMLWKPPPTTEVRHIRHVVTYRVVSRGINVGALRRTIEGIRAAMRETPSFPYMIEVVMDSHKPADIADLRAQHAHSVDQFSMAGDILRSSRGQVLRNRRLRLERKRLRELMGTLKDQIIGLPKPSDDLAYIEVPKNFEPANGTLYKARALHYANLVSPLGEHQWIVHCDEETIPHRSGVIGIAAFIEKEEAKRPGLPRVGQGTITYHRKLREHPFFTMVDMARTGSDLGRTHLSMLLGIPVFGMHGSYIVLRKDVETIGDGFDIGAIGSLTEDAWLGLKLAAAGVRFGWIHGTMIEQCTEKLADLEKQRGRWFNGQVRTSFKCPVPLRFRIIMIFSMAVWAAAPISWIYTVSHLLLGGYISPDVRMLANLSLAIYITTTLVGLRVNMREHGITRITEKIKWAATWMMLLPVFSLIEAGAITKAVIRPAKKFHVVTK